MARSVTLRVKVTGLQELIRDLERVGGNPRAEMRKKDVEVAALIKSETQAKAQRARNMSRAARSNTYTPQANGIEVRLGQKGASSSSDLSWAAPAQVGSTLRQFARPIKTSYTVDPAVRAGRRNVAEPWADAIVEAVS